MNHTETLARIATDPARAEDIRRGLAGVPEGDRLLAELFHVNPSADGDITHLLTADDILLKEWPEPVCVVPGMLYAGYGILAGRPKIGKSRMALQLAEAEGAGGMFFGKRLERGSVLYMALEDTPARLKKRMTDMRWPVGLPVSFLTMADYANEFGDFANGGADKIAHAIEKHKYRLVVVDTFSRAIQQTAPRNGDQNDPLSMMRLIAPIQEAAHSHNSAVLFIDHHRKNGMTGDDAITDVYGSVAKSGVADTVWGLYKERGKPGAKLQVVGRDTGAEVTLQIHMDGITGIWQCDGEADKLEITARRREIIDFLSVNGKSKLSEIAKSLDQDKGNLSRRLADLLNEGFISKDGDYFVAP